MLSQGLKKVMGLILLVMLVVVIVLWRDTIATNWRMIGNAMGNKFLRGEVVLCTEYIAQKAPKTCSRWQVISAPLVKNRAVCEWLGGREGSHQFCNGVCNSSEEKQCITGKPELAN